MCSRQDIARKIAETLLDDGALNEPDFPDTNAILEHVQGVVLAHLRDFKIIQGNIL